jgi:hypothetical protein
MATELLTFIKAFIIEVRNDYSYIEKKAFSSMECVVNPDEDSNEKRLRKRKTFFHEATDNTTVSEGGGELILQINTIIFYIT